MNEDDTDVMLLHNGLLWYIVVKLTWWFVDWAYVNHEVHHSGWFESCTHRTCKMADSIDGWLWTEVDTKAQGVEG